MKVAWAGRIYSKISSRGRHCDVGYCNVINGWMLNGRHARMAHDVSMERVGEYMRYPARREQRRSFGWIISLFRCLYGIATIHILGGTLFHGMVMPSAGSICNPGRLLDYHEVFFVVQNSFVSIGTEKSESARFP